MKAIEEIAAQLLIENGIYISQIDSRDGVHSIYSLLDAERNVLFSASFPFGEPITVQFTAEEGVTITLMD